MFMTGLSVLHIDRKRWELRDPLLWQGQRELVVIRSGFETDFASIPRVLRWFLDNAGANSEAAVLHDAVWRESKRESGALIDPADADGMFRRALRETGATALTRGLMWFGVRAAAIFAGRYGKRGPARVVKIAQLVGMLFLGLVAAGVPTLVAGVGMIIYWLASWVVALVWQVFERRRFTGFTPNWPWPHDTKLVRTRPPPRQYLKVLDLDEADAQSILALAAERKAANQTVSDEDLDPYFGGLPG